MNLPCEVIMDLIPLCKDGVASSESCRLVDEHTAVCDACRREYESIENANMQSPSLPDEKMFLQRLKKQAFKMQMLLLIGGALLGVSMTFSMNVFYNFLLMPAVGMLAYVIFGKRFYAGPALVFILSIISNSAYGIFGERLGLTALGAVFASWIIYSAVYAFLALLGWAAAWLLHYAFGKNEDDKTSGEHTGVKFIGIAALILALIGLVAVILKSFLIR